MTAQNDESQKRTDDIDERDERRVGCGTVAADWGRSKPRGSAADAGAVFEGAEVFDKGIRRRSRDGVERRAVHRDLRRDGDCEGHRDVLVVRTPHAAVFRQSSYCVYPQRKSDWVEQAAAPGGCVCTAIAGAGAADD